MTIYDFIRRHRAQIDEAIDRHLHRYDGNGGRGAIPNPPPRHNDEERRQWILNDEGLYLWARREGVPI